MGCHCLLQCMKVKSESEVAQSDSSRPHGLQPTRLLRPWDFPGKSTRVGCHCRSKFHCSLTAELRGCKSSSDSLEGRYLRATRKTKGTLALCGTAAEVKRPASTEECELVLAGFFRVSASTCWVVGIRANSSTCFSSKAGNVSFQRLPSLLPIIF